MNNVRRRWGALLLAALGLLGACGSTVPLAEQRALERGGLNVGGSGSADAGDTFGSAAGATSAQGGGGGGSGAPSGTLAGQQGATGLSSSGVSDLAGGTGTGGAGAPVAASSAGDGPGVTATTINVGDQYSPSAAAEDAALGFGGLNPGDTRAETDAVVTYINSHGGVAGRKLNVIWYQINQTDNIQQQEQGACTAWTTDNKSFAISSGVPIWDQCAANAHVIAPVAGDIAQEDSAIMSQFPGDFNVTGMTVDRTMRATIKGLSQQGYFTRGAKLGIATWDESDFQYGITHVALPLLGSLGFNNVPVEYISVPQAEQDLSASSADVSNAILKFRSEGIDHVLLFDGTAGINSSATLVLLWMNDANGQAYYPRYGLNSTSGLSTIAPDVPSMEMQNSLAVAWFPSLDLSSGDFASIPLNDSGKLCLKIMSDAGQPAASQNAQAVAFSICDHYFFIQYALDRVKGPLNQADAIAAINSVGTGFPVISTFQDNYSPSQHDGPLLVRNASFVGSCDCYRYTSGAYYPG